VEVYIVIINEIPFSFLVYILTFKCEMIGGYYIDLIYVYDLSNSMVKGFVRNPSMIENGPIYHGCLAGAAHLLKCNTGVQSGDPNRARNPMSRVRSKDHLTDILNASIGCESIIALMILYSWAT